MEELSVEETDKMQDIVDKVQETTFSIRFERSINNLVSIVKK